MLPARIFLAIVGVAYLFLSAWCSVAPNTTAESVGFKLQKGSGESEFFVVYGGLEFAWGLVFIAPLVWADTTKTLLAVCLAVHASSVVFRSIAFFLFSGFGTTTYALAAAEWVIFLIAASLFYYVSTAAKGN